MVWGLRYVCQLCEDSYSTQYENVIACADSQIGNFVEWIKQQDFYNNTTVVIVGDHLCMDYEFYQQHGVTADRRRIYNCFINPALDTDGLSVDRSFTSLDIFPTVLSSIGATWDGDRLGMGANLFSDTKTLVESIGIDALNSELRKRDRFYDDTFLYGTKALLLSERTDENTRNTPKD